MKVFRIIMENMSPSRDVLAESFSEAIEKLLKSDDGLVEEYITEIKIISSDFID